MVPILAFRKITSGVWDGIYFDPVGVEMRPSYGIYL